MILKRISQVVFFLILLELCLGGGGRLIAFGPVSLRMILFGLAISLCGILFIKGKTIPSRYWKMIFLFLISILFGVAVGILNHNPTTLLWEDVKPLLYFLILPFFALVIEQKEIELAILTIKSSSLLMAIVFLTVLIFIALKIIPFISFYTATEKSAEFFYRGELSFFYKGFLFFGIGSIFYYFSESKYRYWLISIFVLAIIASVTRGLLFSLALTFVIYLWQKKKYWLVSFALLLALYIGLLGNLTIATVSRWVDSASKNESTVPDPNLFGDKNFSDSGRIIQAKEVLEQISISTLLIGHGFGQGTQSRPVHMEISCLEIFHKQGIVGLAFWTFFAGMLFVSYKNSVPSQKANAFFYCSLFIFVESLTNQYFNNPIGMSILLLSLVSLDKLQTQP